MTKSSACVLFTTCSLALLQGASGAVVATIGSGVTSSEFSGTQGQDGWSYGYWDVSADASPGTYGHLTDFTAFLGGEGSGPWGDLNHWSGDRWDYNPPGASVGNPPWTVITADILHGSDSVPGPEHAAILRYAVEDAPGDQILLTGFFNNLSPSGDGTTGRIFHNGVEVYSVLTNGSLDNLGGGILITGVSTGDFIDFMVDKGPGNSDASDDTIFSFTVDRIPEPSTSLMLLAGVAGVLAPRRRRA